MFWCQFSAHVGLSALVSLGGVVEIQHSSAVPAARFRLTGVVYWENGNHFVSYSRFGDRWYFDQYSALVYVPDFDPGSIPLRILSEDRRLCDLFFVRV
jgi:hypothetical protein